MKDNHKIDGEKYLTLTLDSKKFKKALAKEEQKLIKRFNIPFLINQKFKKTQKEGNMFTDVTLGNDEFARRYAGTWQDTWHEVVINKVQNGWIVKVGCVTFVETSWKKICKALEEYWDDPVKAEKKYYKK